ncbi:PTS sugar transporter subunit IIA [Enterococcus raffinosus]|uniref:PTS mannose transporter subunit IIA n=1 Tax=Enterococcus raffinosus TaxID=71452 RepID=A0AAW8T9Y9_9ENTE|nr:PTS mannose transporter subunit IIA [Enterococcus raffinosus]MDT2522044.1 PTS mannose transporter subunit IIA [Enterococcus raffinosus]MDT2528388.1 PTS mannose transporter subunit IIA [Enterococcus raffinosus]MDT2533145.1 PTS mannose transporter subunit IIA [Enterococcus raffinosus]MDT2543585.1 PTS mannose transporter subunit IIA [Enterococcus raffinosus]MDT2553699.1 PTS mannose transporter subunit IIA [Enterococcus raffinosus]
MKGILIVSHGNLAEGMRETLELFSGKLEQLDTVSLSAGEAITDFKEKLSNKIDLVDTGDGVVVFCDLAFGTPANIVAKMLSEDLYKDRLQIITGMNLPLILEYSQLRSENVDFNDMISVGKDGIINLNQMLKI